MSREFKCDEGHADCVVRMAKVDSLNLGYEDHGIFTAIIGLDYGTGGHQGAGLFALDEYDEASDERHGTAQGLEFVIRCCKAFGVRAWEDIKGRDILAHASMGKVYGFEPMPTRSGKPFYFADLWEAAAA